jgi:hypothetical protein
VREGETRTLGAFRRVECLSGGVLLHIDADGRLLRLGAKQLSDVDFVSFRSDTTGAVSCGPLPTPLRVLATYRTPGTGAVSSAADGDIVAIEVVPDEYRPPSR